LPVLSALPLAGGLFASSRRQQRQTELVVLITPHRFDAASNNASLPFRDQREMIDRGQALKAAGDAP
jgi:Flp pilus assembly secretin CpaC